MASNIPSPLSVTTSRSFSSFPRSQDIVPSALRSSTANRSNLSPADSLNQPSSSSSQSTSSPSPTPTSGTRNNNKHYQRPSTLHGLKHKLHSNTCAKSLHVTNSSCNANVSNRRKSVGHIPLSPLARTPSPSPLPASPTRSPSPLAFPIGHQPGSSNTTQSYSPCAGTTPVTTSGTQTKKSFVRPKGTEPGSPLLRRALSPDRLHPRSAESKCSHISPLCSSGHSPVVKTHQARSGVIWRQNTQHEKEKESDMDYVSQTNDTNISSTNNENRLSLTLSGPGELLPRIAEEKDSPTNGQEKKACKNDASEVELSKQKELKSDPKIKVNKVELTKIEKSCNNEKIDTKSLKSENKIKSDYNKLDQNSKGDGNEESKIDIKSKK